MVTAGYSIDTITSLKAISTTELVTGYSRLVIEKYSWYIYISTSTATADNNNILLPTSGAGRWFKISSSIDTEEIQDIIGNLITDSSVIDFTYDDVSNSLTGTIKANSITSNHILDGTIVDADISNSANISQSKIAGLTSSLAGKVDSTGLTEVVQDIVGSLLVAGTNVTINYDDGLNTITIDATGGSGGSVGNWDDLYPSVTNSWDLLY